MKVSLVCLLLLGCNESIIQMENSLLKQQKVLPKYFAGQRVEFKFDKEGIFWSKVCENIATIKDYGADNTNVLYDVEINCVKLGETGSMYKRFNLNEEQIIRVVEEGE